MQNVLLCCELSEIRFLPFIRLRSSEVVFTKARQTPKRRASLYTQESQFPQTTSLSHLTQERSLSSHYPLVKGTVMSHQKPDLLAT